MPDRQVAGTMPRQGTPAVDSTVEGAHEDALVASLRRKLAASEARFHNVVANSPDGNVVIDSDGIIRYVNAAAESIFGYDRTRLIGEVFGFPTVAGDVVEIEIIKPGGKPVLAEMRVVPIEWEESSATLATLRDVSEHSNLLSELHRSTRELEQFASVVSHDVRSPLRNLYLLTGWLLDDHAASLNMEAMEDIQLIRTTTTRMQRLLEDLLHYIRVDRVKRVARGISLDQVLDDALEQLSDDIFRSGARIEREPLPCIDCNVQQMVTFFRHILSNAIVHCERKPLIRICCSVDESSCQISVADNGIGIESRNLENVFIPFNHLHSKDQHDGSGIGLATSKKIIERHHGRIWIESDQQVGTVVQVKLPLSISEPGGLT